jgi:hypothetical protein
MNNRRKAVHFNATTNPTAEWTAQQITEAFPWDTAPKYLIRNRDSIKPKPSGCGKIIKFPRVGGLHHRYKWEKAA